MTRGFSGIGVFFARILHGNLGVDFWSNRPILTIIWDNLPYTLLLIAIGVHAMFEHPAA